MSNQWGHGTDDGSSSYTWKGSGIWEGRSIVEISAACKSGKSNSSTWWLKYHGVI